MPKFYENKTLDHRMTERKICKSGPNLDLLCIQQLVAAPFLWKLCKMLFWCKTIRKGLNSE